MVIARIRFVGRKSTSVHIFSSGRIWDFKNQPGSENQGETSSQNKARPNTLGFWFSSGPVPQPGSKGLMPKPKSMGSDDLRAVTHAYRVPSCTLYNYYQRTACMDTANIRAQPHPCHLTLLQRSQGTLLENLEG